LGSQIGVSQIEVQIRVQNQGPKSGSKSGSKLGIKSGSQFGVLNWGPKLGSPIGVSNRGPKSGSQFGVSFRGPNLGSQFDVLIQGLKYAVDRPKFNKFNKCLLIGGKDQSYYLHLAMQVKIPILRGNCMFFFDEYIHSQSATSQRTHYATCRPT
jgi:hypothetical protein